MIWAPTCACVCGRDMQNAFDGIVESGQKAFLWRFYDTSDKLQFFHRHSVERAVSLFPLHILSSIAIYALAAPPDPSLFPSIHLFPAECKKLVYIPDGCWCSFFFFPPFAMSRCCVFTFSANTHSHVHQHRQYSPTHFFPVSSCTRCKFILSCARSSTRWWWNGYTVWFGRLCVILIFYVCYSLLSARCCGGEGGTRRVEAMAASKRNKNAFCLCADFLAWWWFVCGVVEHGSGIEDFFSVERMDSSRCFELIQGWRRFVKSRKSNFIVKVSLQWRSNSRKWILRPTVLLKSQRFIALLNG